MKKENEQDWIYNTPSEDDYIGHDLSKTSRVMQKHNSIKNRRSLKIGLALQRGRVLKEVVDNLTHNVTLIDHMISLVLDVGKI